MHIQGRLNTDCCSTWMAVWSNHITWPLALYLSPLATDISSPLTTLLTTSTKSDLRWGCDPKADLYAFGICVRSKKKYRYVIKGIEGRTTSCESTCQISNGKMWSSTMRWSSNLSPLQEGLQIVYNALKSKWVQHVVGPTCHVYLQKSLTCGYHTVICKSVELMILVWIFSCFHCPFAHLRWDSSLSTHRRRTSVKTLCYQNARLKSNCHTRTDTWNEKNHWN